MPGQCDSHDEHTQNMRDIWSVLNRIKSKVNNQEGRWIIVGVVLFGALAGLFGLQKLNDDYNQKAISEIKNNTTKTAETAERIDKTVLAYIAANTQRLNEIKRRLDRVEAEVREIRRVP